MSMITLKFIKTETAAQVFIVSQFICWINFSNNLKTLLCYIYILISINKLIFRRCVQYLRCKYTVNAVMSYISYLFSLYQMSLQQSYLQGLLESHERSRALCKVDQVLDYWKVYTCSLYCLVDLMISMNPLVPSSSLHNQRQAHSQ